MHFTMKRLKPFGDRRVILILCLVFVAILETSSVTLAGRYGPPERDTYLISPDERYLAVAMISGSGPNVVHYQVYQQNPTRFLFCTNAQYKTPNDVKAGAFSPDSRYFAAAYHYGHKGNYTWIGIWEVFSGRLVNALTRKGWIRDLSWLFSEPASPRPPVGAYPEAKLQTPRQPRDSLPDLQIWISENPSLRLGPIPCDHPDFRIVVSVGNFGKAPAHNVKVVGQGGDSRVSNIEFVEPGQVINLWRYPEVKGWRRGYGLFRYSFQYIVDPDNFIVESIEDNNISKRIDIECF